MQSTLILALLLQTAAPGGPAQRVDSLAASPARDRNAVPTEPTTVRPISLNETGAGEDSTAAAQQQEPPDRWAAAIDFGFASSSGNSSLTSLTTGVRVRHLQTRLFKLEWSVSFRYGESQGEVVARNLESKLDFDVGPNAQVAPFVFASAERDPFRKLDLRAKTGSGVKYTFYRADEGEASFRIAAQYSRENFTAEADQDPRTDGAWSMEFKGARTVGSLRVENSTSWDPVFDDFGDYNLDMKSKISSRITRRLALTLTHNFTYDSTPAPDVGRSDQRFQAGLTIDL